MQLHVTAFHACVFVPVDSSTEDRQECLITRLSLESSWRRTSECANLKVNLAVEAISRTVRGCSILAHAERVRLKERLPRANKRSKRGLGGVEGTQTKLKASRQPESPEFSMIERLTRSFSASMATVSLNLDRHINTSCSRTKAGGASDKVRVVMATDYETPVQEP